jgi:hypothetical protein
MHLHTIYQMVTCFRASVNLPVLGGAGQVWA